MQNLDIPFPETEYELMNKFRSFSLIYPYDHPLSQSIRIDMMIRTLSFSDTEYAEFLRNDRRPQDMTPIDGKLYEINYIRECTLKNVSSFEWKNNYGPGSIREFLRFTKNMKTDDFVKIIFVESPNYSLKTLNINYGSNHGSI